MQPTASELREREAEKDELAEVPPETNLDLQDCSEEEWRKFREQEAAKLMAAAAETPSIPSSSVVVGGSTSTMLGRLDTVTTASAASTLKSGTLTLRTQRSAAQSDMDTQDLQKMFNFSKQDLSWKVPIIAFKDKILDIVGGENFSPQFLTSQFNLVYLSR